MSEKDLEINQLKGNVNNLQSDLSTSERRLIQIKTSLDSLQLEYDVKVKEVDDVQSKYETVTEQYRQLMEKQKLNEKESEMFSQFSVPDSLEYDPEVWEIYMLRPHESTLYIRTNTLIFSNLCIPVASCVHSNINDLASIH